MELGPEDVSLLERCPHFMYVCVYKFAVLIGPNLGIYIMPCIHTLIVDMTDWLEDQATYIRVYLHTCSFSFAGTTVFLQASVPMSRNTPVQADSLNFHLLYVYVCLIFTKNS